MAISILLAAYLVPGVAISGMWASLWLAVFLSLINITLKPLFILITLPINILSLGFFTFIINALFILLASSVIKGFEVQGFFGALFFSIFLSLISYLMNGLINLEENNKTKKQNIY